MAALTRIRRRVTGRLLHLFFLASRPITLGVRAAVFDARGRVFLVRHGYVPGWHFPGGGVEPGETAATCLTRELAEEGNLELAAAPELFAVYFNRAASRRDHVIVYVCRGARQSAPREPDREIAEAGFFAPDALPTGTTAATRARLDEIAGKAEPSHFW